MLKLEVLRRSVKQGSWANATGSLSLQYGQNDF
jgi:hypothetical protein